MKTSHLLLALIALPIVISAETLNVPGDFQTIQSAIDNADDCDTVLVQTGTYYERIRFSERAIVVGSLFIVTGDEGYIERTVIDADGEGRAVTFEAEEPRRPTLSGFTLTGGNTENGGAIFCSYFNPTLENLIITGNHATADGGGIFCRRQSNPRISSVRIENNISDGQGGGLYCRDTSGPYILNTIISSNRASSGGGIFSNTSSSLMLTDVNISGNEAVSLGGGIACQANSNIRMTRTLVVDNSAEDLSGGGIYMSASIVDMANVTLCSNRTNGEGGGLFVIGESTLEIVNSIFWGNDNDQVHSHGSPNPAVPITVSYSDFEGGRNGIYIQGNAELEWLDGNIEGDPLFADAERGNYHLTSNSPCRDAGDPDSRNDPDGTRADMGALYYDPARVPWKNKSFDAPHAFQLLDVFPNPFNGITTIRFNLTYQSPVKLILFDQGGRSVIGQTLTLPAGNQDVSLSCEDLTSGLYYLVVDNDRYHFNRKLVLIR